MMISRQPRQTRLARQLRREQTPYEAKLWRLLRDRRLKNFKFRRQHPIERYVADFACVEKRLILELDGASHHERGERDAVRDEVLAERGWTTLRFSNRDLMSNAEGIILTVLARLETSQPGL
jgi:very-short-patch-repair endonuclease